MSESREELEARKWREAVALRRPNYKLIKKCCETCRFVIGSEDGDFTCTHDELRPMYGSQALEDRRRAATVRLENTVSAHGVCDAWE